MKITILNIVVLNLLFFIFSLTTIALTPDEIIKLKEKGVSDEIILKMIEMENKKEAQEADEQTGSANEQLRWELASLIDGEKVVVTTSYLEFDRGYAETYKTHGTYATYNKSIKCKLFFDELEVLSFYEGSILGLGPSVTVEGYWECERALWDFKPYRSLVKEKIPIRGGSSEAHRAYVILKQLAQ